MKKDVYMLIIKLIINNKLIREEIRNLKLSLGSYRNKDDITDSINDNSSWKLNSPNTLLSYAVPKTVKRSSICQCIIKACVRCFLSNFSFSPNDSASKTMKNIFFISSKKLFSFSRYSNFCIFVFLSFFPVSHCLGD